jgi:hypothetical protein
MVFQPIGTTDETQSMERQPPPSDRPTGGGYTMVSGGVSWCVTIHARIMLNRLMSQIRYCPRLAKNG